MDRLRPDRHRRTQYHRVGADLRLICRRIRSVAASACQAAPATIGFVGRLRIRGYAWACCGLFAVASVTFLLNAGISSGLRLVMMLPSSTTSLSTHFAPALIRSVWIDGHEVTVFPFTTPASINIQGPWQMAATGLPDATKLRTKSTAGFSIRSLSGFIWPPGRISAA